MNMCKELLNKVVRAPYEIQKIMRKHNLAFTDLDDPMQKLAFTIYTELVDLSITAKEVLEKGDNFEMH